MRVLSTNFDGIIMVYSPKKPEQQMIILKNL